MAESHIISALIKKRSELSGEIVHYEKFLKECRENLISIDNTIHIFDDSYDLRTIKSKKVVKICKLLKNTFCISLNNQSFNNKMPRANFSATFFFQCMYVLEVRFITFDIDSVKITKD